MWHGIIPGQISALLRIKTSPIVRGITIHSLSVSLYNMSLSVFLETMGMIIYCFFCMIRVLFNIGNISKLGIISRKQA